MNDMYAKGRYSNSKPGTIKSWQTKLNEVGDTPSGQKKLGGLAMRRQKQGLDYKNRANNSFNPEDEKNLRDKGNKYLTRSMDAYKKARSEQDKAGNPWESRPQQMGNAFRSGERKEEIWHDANMIRKYKNNKKK
jgi:hypothetical protein